MPPYSQSRRDPTSSGGPISRTPERPILSPVTPAVTGINYPSPDDDLTEVDSNLNKYRGHLARALYTHQNIASSVIGDAQVAPPSEAASLDRIWGTIRLEKERKLARERPKVQSLEDVTPELDSPELPSIQIPVMQSQASIPKSLKKQKSISSFRESTDGRSIMATFEMPPNVAKQDIHLSFQRNRLVVTWKTVEMSDPYEEDGVVMRERLEKMFHRTLPLPEGTRFEEVQAVMPDRDRRLVLRYPNMRCYRVDSRSRSGDS